MDLFDKIHTKLMVAFDSFVSRLRQGVASTLGTSGIKNYCEEPDSWSESFLLGEKYDFTDEGRQARELRLASIPYFCYRHGFLPIVSSSGKELTSDIGWGCMHRSGQMFSASILQIILGPFDDDKVHLSSCNNKAFVFFL